MAGLSFGESVILEKEPVDAFNAGRNEILIQVGLDRFIVTCPQFIDYILLHVPAFGVVD